MPRDYKNRPTSGPAKRARKPLPPWAGLAGGFALGLCVAVGAFMEGRYPGTVVSWSTDLVPQPDAGLEAEVAEAQETKRRPRFEFYNLLPEMEVSVADTKRLERRDAPKKPKPKAAPKTEAERAARILAGEDPVKVTDDSGYLVQVGSFKDAADADRLKAELALTGHSAFIQTAMMSDRSKRHRVRLGPYRGYDEARRIGARLIDSGVRPLLVRVDS